MNRWLVPFFPEGYSIVQVYQCWFLYSPIEARIDCRGFIFTLLISFKQQILNFNIFQFMISPISGFCILLKDTCPQVTKMFSYAFL